MPVIAELEIYNLEEEEEDENKNKYKYPCLKQLNGKVVVFVKPNSGFIVRRNKTDTVKEIGFYSEQWCEYMFDDLLAGDKVTLVQS